MASEGQQEGNTATCGQLTMKILNILRCIINLDVVKTPADHPCASRWPHLLPTSPNL